MKKFITKRNIIIVLVVLLGLGYWAWSRQNANKAKDEVRIAIVEKKDLTQTLTISGEVAAQKMAELKFLTSGKLNFVRVSNGDEVKAGQWLAGIDVGELDASVTRAWYAYQAADAAAKKVEDDLKGKDTTETFSEKNTRVAAQAARDVAYENWLSAKRSRDFAILKTPISGRVTKVDLYAAGEIVSAGDGIVVVDPLTLYFDTEVNETDISRILEGQKAEVILEAFGDRKFESSVVQIGFATEIGSSGATVIPVKIGFDKKDLSDMKLGFSGDAVIQLRSVKDVLSLPSEAVRDGKVTLENGKEIKVETGLETDFEIEIKSGLNAGDRVIIR